MIGEKVDLAQPGGFEPTRNQSPVRPNDPIRDRNLISQTRGYSSVSELSSSDDAGNHWVGEASIPMNVQHQCLAPTAIPASSFLYRTSTFRIAVLRGDWNRIKGSRSHMGAAPERCQVCVSCASWLRCSAVRRSVARDGQHPHEAHTGHRSSVAIDEAWRAIKELG